MENVGISHRRDVRGDDRREDRREEGATAGVAPQEARKAEREESKDRPDSCEQRSRDMGKKTLSDSHLTN